MKTLLSLKKLAENIPYPLGKFTSHVPYSWRLGSTYSYFDKFIPIFEKADPETQLKYIITKLDAIVRYAQKNFPFYMELYGKDPIRIRRLSDFEALPVITRSQVRNYFKQTTGTMLLNTGGTSGEPLAFYIDKNAWAREWAHMHFIWAKRGYHPYDLMFTMLGKNLFGTYYRYNAVHNEMRLNPYMDAEVNIEKVSHLFKIYSVKYFQGYPSSVYNFLREIESIADEHLVTLIKSKIKCVFLSSEQPLPYMIDYIRGHWNLDYLSWYGHSEMCVLAYEDQFTAQYKPLMTYGFAEVVDGVICGTSFHNHDMPLIRYYTGDKVFGHYGDSGLINGFSITEGRAGDYIEDKFGRQISLTGLIFGRHHNIFNIADYVQVYQPKAGEIVLIVTIIGNPQHDANRLSSYFDFRDTDLDLTFRVSTRPILTKAGKFKLLISSEEYLRNGEIYG